MNRFILAIAIIIPLATVFFVVGNSRKNREKEVAEAVAAEQVADLDAEKELVIEINGENFEETVIETGQPVLLDFWAPWCGPCMMLGPHVDSIASDYEGMIVVGKVNIDDHKELADQYEVDSIPRVLIFKDGEVVGQLEGFTPETPDEIRKIIDGLIAP